MAVFEREGGCIGEGGWLYWGGRVAVLGRAGVGCIGEGVGCIGEGWWLYWGGRAAVLGREGGCIEEGGWLYWGRRVAVLGKEGGCIGEGGWLYWGGRVAVLGRDGGCITIGEGLAVLREGCTHAAPTHSDECSYVLLDQVCVSPLAGV